MKAILLAAGFGSRLKPLTDYIPKCLLPVGGVPILAHWVNILSKLGIREILINTHYHHALVHDYFIVNEFKNVNIKFSYEPILLGTAGTLIKNEKFIDEDTILIHADNFCTSDLKKLIDDHKNRQKECIMTMLTFETDYPEQCGIVKFNNQNVIINFYEKVKDANGNIANAAIYIITRELIDSILMHNTNCTDFSNEIIPFYLKKIFLSHSNGKIIDIGTMQNFIAANQLASLNNV
jgi:mannose-1-phosphate guanylyltransferase